MSKKIKVALAGLGSRGKDTYAKAAELFPDKMEITAIADINPKKVAMVAERYHIPLLMVGGAVRRPARIDVYGSQQDIAATLLSQLCLPHDEFLFSKDLLDEASPHFAFFTVPDAFGVLTPDNRLIYDCQGDKVVLDEGAERGKNLPKGKAYLQKLYDDIANR